MEKEALRTTALEVINCNIAEITKNQKDRSMAYVYFINSCAQIELARVLEIIDDKRSAVLSHKATLAYQKGDMIDE